MDDVEVKYGVSQKVSHLLNYIPVHPRASQCIPVHPHASLCIPSILEPPKALSSLLESPRLLIEMIQVHQVETGVQYMFT